MSSSHVVVDLAAKIMVVSIVVLSILIIFMSFLHLYANWFWNRPHSAPNTHRRRGNFTAGHQVQQPANAIITVLRCGLNPSFLETIPVTRFNINNFKEESECVVCLSEFDEGDKTRILPKCNHGFHAECIDMWFYSHSTCPICRNPVSDDTEISVENLQTNVLYWGDETEVSTLTSQLGHVLPTSEPASSSSSSSQTITARPDLVIGIPREVDCDEDKKSPVSSGLKSLRRILSGNRRFINPFSNAGINAEQGTRGHV